MVSGPSHRTIETALRQLQAEREARLKKLTTEERERLEKAEAVLQRRLRAAAKKKQKFAEELTKEETELKALRKAVEEQAAAAAEEQRLFRLQQRIEEFRGNDTEELRQRLVTEGFDPRLIEVTLRRRTLDESLERPAGLRAKFTHLEDEVLARKEEGPFAAIYSGRADLEALSDRRVLDHLYSIQREQEALGYLRPNERNFVERFEYAAQRAQEYRSEAPREEFSRAANVAEFIKERDQMQQFLHTIGAASQDTQGFYKERERQAYQRPGEHPRDQH